ncbi:hypothetical protein JYU34_021579 [Plutella xylostella]|uniref:Uncharacterized protein n=2 Tax=Plutella xylostella TaxID=51655 RepID=A0ABQ7PTW0_PLUXY|nr:hypothetical protein JYU34_021579 [Plutella xylostella]CAG9086980.1 unnamed protein product [Plutella xylostella]
MPAHHPEGDDEDRPCRACTDFKTWAKDQKKTTLSTSKPGSSKPKDCPLAKDELGRYTWGFLHTLAAHFPRQPTETESYRMCKFINIFAQFYPCEPCRLDFQDDIKENPPQTKSREALSQWLCERHNTVNVKLGKPEFDCSKVNERWRDGWLDGSCD